MRSCAGDYMYSFQEHVFHKLLETLKLFLLCVRKHVSARLLGAFMSDSKTVAGDYSFQKHVLNVFHKLLENSSFLAFPN